MVTPTATVVGTCWQCGGTFLSSWVQPAWGRRRAARQEMARLQARHAPIALCPTCFADAVKASDQILRNIRQNGVRPSRGKAVTAS